MEYAVTDDHIPLLDKGLRVIDVIDLDYLGPQGSGKPTITTRPRTRSTRSPRSR
jgi:hypothetical protein